MRRALRRGRRSAFRLWRSRSAARAARCEAAGLRRARIEDLKACRVLHHRGADADPTSSAAPRPHAARVGASETRGPRAQTRRRRDLRVHRLSRLHRGSVRADPRTRVGLRSSISDFFARLQPGAHQSRRQGAPADDDPQGDVAARRRKSRTSSTRCTARSSRPARTRPRASRLPRRPRSSRTPSATSTSR